MQIVEMVKVMPMGSCGLCGVMVWVSLQGSMMWFGVLAQLRCIHLSHANIFTYFGMHLLRAVERRGCKGDSLECEA